MDVNNMDKYNIEPHLNLDVHSRVTEYIRNKNKAVDTSLDKYFKYKYGWSVDEIKSIMLRVNNFKLKGFEHIIQGDSEYFYDKGKLILSVTGNITIGFAINHVWRKGLML